MGVLDTTDVNGEYLDESEQVLSFDSDGFSLGDNDPQESFKVNRTGQTYVVWNWKAGGTAASNTDGTITSSVSANPTAGFSIVGYTGSGSAGTVGHGLSQKPDMIILKKRSAVAQWPVGVDQGSMDWTDYIALDKTNNSGDYPYWNDTAPTSSVFSLGSDGDVNQSTGTFIAYCFHSVEGYSQVGSYTGNGNADGPFAYTGFRPAFFLVKNMSSASTMWRLYDNKRPAYNAADLILYPDTTGVESGTGHPVDLDSNGIKIRGTFTEVNTSGDIYLYLAFAESPFKTSRAR